MTTSVEITVVARPIINTTNVTIPISASKPPRIVLSNSGKKSVFNSVAQNKKNIENRSAAIKPVINPVLKPPPYEKATSLFE